MNNQFRSRDHGLYLKTLVMAAKLSSNEFWDNKTNVIKVPIHNTNFQDLSKNWIIKLIYVNLQSTASFVFSSKNRNPFEPAKTNQK